MDKEQILKNIQKVKEEHEKREKLMLQWWNEEHTFTEIDDIRDVPITDDPERKQYYIDRLIKFGAIPKNKLIAGHTYLGKCRNAVNAIWNGKTFTYVRCKFGTTYDENINHFEDDDGYDIFIPIQDLGIKK